MQVHESNVTFICNEIIKILNKHKASNEEIPIVLAQLLIYCGKGISQKNIDFNSTAWEELERLYYSENKDNDIGLGLVLNGGAMMQALNINIIKDSDATANKGIRNVQVSTKPQNPQKSSSATTRPKASKRIRRPANSKN